jgi:hypothetical protein
MVARTGIWCVLACAAVLLSPSGHAAGVQRSQEGPGLAPYEGRATWVDLYDPKVLRDPVRAVEAMKARGVETVYLETANWRVGRKVNLPYPVATGSLIEAAHDAGLRVVGWYLPGLVDLRTDLRRSLAAVRFASPRGDHLDSFSLDIEANLVRLIPRRNHRLLLLSDRLRRAVGAGYALGAIVPDKRSTATDKPSLWPHFPYRRLASRFDVFLPMSYSTGRGRGAAYVYAYTRDNVNYLRLKTGDPSLPVHVIGGIASKLAESEAEAVIQASQDAGAIGAGFYKFSLTRADLWPLLAALP